MAIDEDDGLAAALDEFLFRIFTMSAATSMDRLAEIDLPFTQARTVFVLGRSGEATPIHEVAAALKMSVAAAGRSIDQLVERGLVDRREDPADRRVKRVSLTEAGREFAAGHLEHKRQQLREFTRSIAPGHRVRLRDAITAVLSGEAHAAPPPATGGTDAATGASPARPDQEGPRT